MALFVHVTDACWRDADTHSLTDEVRRFADRVERSQSTQLFDHFPPPFLVKKKLGGQQGRLIAELRQVGEHDVAVFVAVMIRAEAAYAQQFTRDPVGYGDRHFKGLCSRADLETMVKERTLRQLPPQKPLPSAAEYHYLHEAFTSNAGGEGELVCETRDWVERCCDAPFKNWHAHIYETLSNSFGSRVAGQGGALIPVNGRSGWSLLIRDFPHVGLRLLVAPIIDDNSSELAKIRETYRDVLEAIEPTLEQVLRCSRRSYPALLFGDGDIWMDVERDVHANLALSPEESRVLEAARQPGGGFPLFINGRAGSGKSTILQYLFAEGLNFHLANGQQLPMPPVYFTCNPELLRIARRNVENLLRCNSRFVQHSDREELLKEGSSVIAVAFQEFRHFLRELVPASERSQRFALERHVSHARFKQLWTRRFGQEPAALREHGPDLSWHVIRSYIKGLSPDELIDPDEYRQLDQKQLTVTREAYERVYNRVWRWYQELCEANKYWDDQELARYLLENDLVSPTFPGVFCDEAQDFTRVELEIILRLSIFSARKLQPIEIAHVPFAFAGDPFQTLNPTGFRWDEIKASFVEKFILALDPGRRSQRKDLNYRELSLNYRSSPNVVRFSNFVQALRARLFDVSEIRPQTPWTSDRNSPAVVSFSPDNAQLWEWLKKKGDAVIILPCGEGEELQAVQSDVYLKDRIAIVDGAPEIPVLSAGRAKGLEFDTVVVYGFGDRCDAKLLAPIRGGRQIADDPDIALPMQYFINRLYVAVSRPKRRLIVVDTSQGMNRLWEFTQDEELGRSIILALRSGLEMWEHVVARLELGRVEQLADDQAADPGENARAFEAEGMAKRDAYLLRAAAASFRNAGRVREADRAKAHALEYEGTLIEAGRLFLQLQDHANATRCLWRARRDGWFEIVRAAEGLPEINASLEFAVAQLLVGRVGNSQALDVLRRVATKLGAEAVRTEMLSDDAWSAALRALLTEILKNPQTEVEATELCSVTDQIATHGCSLPSSLRAMLHYRAANLTRAIQLWESAGETSSKEYHSSKAKVLPFPGNIKPLSELQLHPEIIAACHGHMPHDVGEDLAGPVGKAYLALKRFEEALPWLSYAKDIGSLVLLARHACDHDVGSVALRAISAALVHIVETSAWSALQRWLDHRTLPGNEPLPKKLRALVSSSRTALDVVITRALARSEAFAALPWDNPRSSANQRPLADYLRTAFRPDGSWKVIEELVVELGAAVERGGNRIDALALYEAVRDGDFNADIKLHAAERWVACKERQSRHEAERGAEALARMQAAEASETRRKLRLGDRKLSAFPEVDAFRDLVQRLIGPPRIADATTSSTAVGASIVTSAPISAPPPPPPVVTTERAGVDTKASPIAEPVQLPIEVAAGRFTFVYNHGRRRLKIEDPKSGDVVVFDAAKGRPEGDGEFAGSFEDGFVSALLGIVLKPRSAAPFIVSVSLAGQPLQLTFGDAPSPRHS